jgi:hypothetical protein
LSTPPKKKHSSSRSDLLNAEETDSPWDLLLSGDYLSNVASALKYEIKTTNHCLVS